MTRKAIDFDKDARDGFDHYLIAVRKELDGIDSKERKAILEEIDGAIKEKMEIMASEKSVERISVGLVEEVLEGFGSPSDLALGYARVARTGPGRQVKFLSLFEAFWAVLIFIPGAFLLSDAIMFWWPDLVSYGQAILGVFYLAGCASLFILIWIQLRDPKVREQIGPFTIVTTLALGLAALSTYGIDRDYLFPGLPAGAANLLLTVLTAFILLGSVWGLGSMLANMKKDRSAAAEEQPQSRSRKYSSKSKGIILMTTAVLAALFIIANGLLMTGGGLGNGRTQEGAEAYRSSEFVGGPYNASIERWQMFTGEFWEDFYKIAYTFNGTLINGSFQLEMRPALDWIKSNTSANDTVVSWWDYGHAIRGYTGRDSAIYMASKNLVNTVGDRNKEGRPWESEQKVKAVSDILLAPNETQLRQGMESLGAKYILITHRDWSDIAYAIIRGAGKDPDDYIRTVDGAAVPKDSARDMFLFKIGAGGDFAGTRIVYKDIDTIIVRIE